MAARSWAKNQSHHLILENFSTKISENEWSDWWSHQMISVQGQCLTGHSPWSHRMPPQFKWHLHSHGDPRHEPCLHPGYGIHWSHRGPCQPYVHLSKRKRRIINSWTQGAFMLRCNMVECCQATNLQINWDGSNMNKSYENQLHRIQFSAKWFHFRIILSSAAHPKWWIAIFIPFCS